MAGAHDILSRFRLDGRVAAVVGGGSGIGRATAALMGAAGAALAVVDRDAAAAQACAGAIPEGRGRAWELDIADAAAVDRVFGEIAGKLGRIDVLVNSAGVAIRWPATEHPIADWEKVVAVNMTGVFLCARAAARHMQARGQGGAIVNVASIMGLSG